MATSICVLIVLFLASQGNGESFTASANQEVVVGEETDLSCSTSDQKSIIWKHTPVGSQTENDVYVNGKVLPPYDQRFKVDRDDLTGEYILTVFDVQKEDSGTYICMGAAEDSHKDKSELIVLDARPSCQTYDVIGDNDCGIKREDFRLTCTVRFSGNIAPAMECSNKELDALKIWGVVSNDASDDKVVYSFVAKARFQMDKKVFLCRTSLSHIPANDVKASVAYVFDTLSKITLTRRDILICYANSSQACSYNWTSSISDKKIPGQTIEILNPGTYQCHAKCPIAGSVCQVRPLVVNYKPEGKAKYPDVKPPIHVSKKVVIIIVCVVVGVVVVSFIGIAFACAYRMLLSSSDPCPTIRYLWKISTDNSMVTGVAILKDSLYVVHRGQKQITVYQATSPCRYLGKITLETLQDPRDIAACSKNSCLYVSDAGHGCIWKVEVGSMMENRDTKISAWVAKVDEPYTLAVISGGRVLIAQRPNTLRIYRADGTTFRTFQMKGDISEPRHAVRTSKGTFIVSHGSKCDKEHRVCEVSAKGEILRSFGNRRGEKDIPCVETGHRMIRMNHPRHLALDESGRVLVVDRENERIIRLDRKLCLVEVLRCPGNENGPVRLFCEATRFLIGRGDAIYVYSIDHDDQQSPQLKAPEKDSEDSDSDDDTDDVKPLMRKEPKQPLLGTQFPRPMQTFSPIDDQSFFGDRAKLRHRKQDSHL